MASSVVAQDAAPCSSSRQRQQQMDKQHQQVENRVFKAIKQKFIEGGVPYMGAVALCLILDWHFLSKEFLT